ncbi:MULTISPECIES: cytochrome b [Salinicola]|nr:MULTISPECIES: cytochrome b [Salinicola]
MLQDSPQVYGSATRFLHWVVAALVIVQLSSVFLHEVWDGNAFSQMILPWHTSIGVSVLALMAIRTLWALSQLGHRPVHDGSLQRMAVWAHVLMYALLIMMPLSGVLMTWGSGYGVHAFGSVLIPGADVPWAAALGMVHEPIAWLITLMILGHVAMAMHHHFGRRDDTLKRMVGRPADPQ